MSDRDLPVVIRPSENWRRLASIVGRAVRPSFENLSVKNAELAVSITDLHGGKSSEANNPNAVETKAAPARSIGARLAQELARRGWLAKQSGPAMSDPWAAPVEQVAAMIDAEVGATSDVVAVARELRQFLDNIAGDLADRFISFSDLPRIRANEGIGKRLVDALAKLPTTEGN